MPNQLKLQKLGDVKNIEQLAAMRHSQNINDVHDESLSFGDRVSDKMANFAGSWTFIISFSLILVCWVVLNSVQLIFHPFDPFPFILLNLVLSCVAAMQAPVIMMSQNRQEEKDRIRAEHDYEINLKAEILVEEVIKRLSKLEQTQQAFMGKQSELVELVSNLKK